MNFSTIQKLQLEGAHRLDAEYYQPEYLDLEKNLQKFKSENLMSISDVTGGKRLPVGDVFSDQGIPYLRVVDINDVFVDFSGIRFISERLHKILQSYQIKEKDILITIVGNTVGLIGYNQLRLDNFNFTENCARIRAKSVLPEYLLTVLLSNIGQMQTQRERVGTAQPKLSLDRLRHFLIPNADREFQNQIKTHIDEAINISKESESIYSQAENLLLEELGLKNINFGEDLAYSVNFSEIKSAKRMDADYFQPKYGKLISKIKEYDAKPLVELAEIKKGGAKIEPKREYNYSEISDVNVGNGEIVFNKVPGSELPANAKNKITGGELIISKVRPTRGAIAIIPDDWREDHIVSGAFSVFNIDSPLREYIQVVLRSVVGKLQLEKPTTGTSYPTVEDEDVKNILIPILSQPIQQKIADLVRQSHEARKKSKELLESAKRKVEELIEKGNGN